MKKNRPVQFPIHDSRQKKARLLSRGMWPAVLLCAALLISGCGKGKGDAGQESPSAADTGATELASAAAATLDESGFAGTLAPAEEEKAPAFSAADKDLTIVLDPGHAAQVPEWTEPVGPDSKELKEADTLGAFGNASSTFEYDLTMNVSKKLRTELEERGYKVVLTHSDTVLPISRAQRATVANDNRADAFIQIYANSSEDTTISGASAMCITEENPYHPEQFKASYRLTKTILDTFCEKTGAKQQNIEMTDTMTASNWSQVPTTLICLGYMSNPDEDLKMNQDSYRIDMANAIADGLDRWFAEMPEEELALHPGMTPGAAGNAAAALSGTAATAAPAAEDPSTAGTIPPYAVPGTNPQTAGQTPFAEELAPTAPGTTPTDPSQTTLPAGVTPGSAAPSAELGAPAAQTGTQNTGTQNTQTGTQNTAPAASPYDINRQAEMGTPASSSSQLQTPQVPLVEAPGSDGALDEDSASLYFTAETQNPADFGVPADSTSDSVDFNEEPDNSTYPGAELGR